MASCEKYSGTAVKSLLAHNRREIPNPSNHDIDKTRSNLNYSLIQRECSDYDYFWARRQSVHCMNRDDMKPLVGWVLTAPKDLKAEQEELFFKESYKFVAERYGKENMVQAIVHQDESGQPHLHICFMPIVYDEKKGYEKICVNDVITRHDLKTFHTDWQKYLNDCGIECSVYTGVTKKNGGNIKVAELKQRRDMNIDVEIKDRWSVRQDEAIKVDLKGGRW